MSDSDRRGRSSGAKPTGSSGNGRPRDAARGKDNARRGSSQGRAQGASQSGRGERRRPHNDDRRGGQKFRNAQQGGRGNGGRPGGQRGDRQGRPTSARRDDRNRDQQRRTESAQVNTAPPLDDDIEFTDLDIEVRKELRSIPKDMAELVGKHLVAAGRLVDSDPKAALEHARYVKTKASRIPVVREAVGIAAYHAGEWAEALSELRAVRRMTHTNMHVAVLADLERALGRPERALDLARETNMADLPPEVAVELRIVAAGARRDLGQLDAAVVALQGPDLDPAKWQPWSARLFYAYADNLLAAGRKEEAAQWFMHAAEADVDDETDAAQRVAELNG